MYKGTSNVLYVRNLNNMKRHFIMLDGHDNNIILMEKLKCTQEMMNTLVSYLLLL